MSHSNATPHALENKIRAILCAQLDCAIKDLETATPFSRSSVIHRTRRTAKKVRAALRLLRTDKSHAFSKVDRRLLSYAAQEIAVMRDADVNIGTARALCKRFTIERALFGKMFQMFDREKNASSSGVAESLHTSAVLLQAVRAKLEQWRPPHLKWRDIESGMERIYRKARSAWRKAAADPSVENLHRCRKRANDLLHNLALVRAIRPKSACKLLQKAKKLTALLGEEHDLVILHQKLDRSRIGIEKDGMTKLIASRRLKLQKKILRTGAKFFDRKPAAFIAKLDD